MKLPTSTKPTSGFHICDILELNKDKKLRKDDIGEGKVDENCDPDDVKDMKKEILSCEGEDKNSISDIKNSIETSPASPASSRDSKSPSEPPRKTKKQSRHEDVKSALGATSEHQLLSETIHQYPHLFQNHPAMRPWFNSNGKFQSLCNTKFILTNDSGSDLVNHFNFKRFHA